MVSVTTFQLCHGSQKAAIDDVETNKQGCVPGKPDAHKQVGQDVAHGLSLPPPAAQTRTPPAPAKGPISFYSPPGSLLSITTAYRKRQACSRHPRASGNVFCVPSALGVAPPADPSLPSTLFKSYLLGVAVIAQRGWRPLWSTGSQVQSF